MAEATAPRRPALLVTRNFPPLLGGMENVNLRLLEALAARGPVLLAGPAGAGAHAAAATEVREAPLRPLWRFLPVAGWNALRLARRHRPALVVGGSGLAAPMAWLAARACGARFALYLHGLDLVVASRIYQALWLPFIRACDLALVNSRHTAALARSSGLPAGRIAVLNPGTDVPPLQPGAAEAFRTRHGFGPRPLLLSVGRLTRRKGLVEFVRAALPDILARHPDALLVVIGEEAADALHTSAGSERARIESAAQAAGVAAHLQFVGRCSGEELSQAYQAAQVHVFPVLEQQGDVEGFGMVALESAAHGLRTVAFAVGGVPDAISPGVSGALVPSGDYAAFAQEVSAMLAAPDTAAQVQAGREFAASKDWAAFARRLGQLLEAGDA